AFDLLGRRWVLRILWELRNEGLGFRELQRAADDPSPTLLAERLVDLRAARVVLPREDGKYELTELGRELLLSLGPLQTWAKMWSRALAEAEPEVQAQRKTTGPARRGSRSVE
ncbi:MAG TPA: winged helix-turn-helix transcriptional regulator, partial [Polyangiaceae bacterium]|nr:winged helix-turn-helix transcriptional regulator [Polyangiaceae bacterium]